MTSIAVSVVASTSLTTAARVRHVTPPPEYRVHPNEPGRVSRRIWRGPYLVWTSFLRLEEAWAEVLDGGARLTIPGARDCTVEEYLGQGAWRVNRTGGWIRIAHAHAVTHDDVLRWCRHHAFDQLPGGDFALRLSGWNRHKREVVNPPRPFLPEVDHPNCELRTLAAIERCCAEAKQASRVAEEDRRIAIDTAAQAGCSLRAIGSVAGLSPTRIHQLVQRQDA
jgi:hypothetical protein